MEGLNDYINSARAQGLTDDQIRQNLQEAGWAESRVNEAIPISHTEIPPNKAAIIPPTISSIPSAEPNETLTYPIKEVSSPGFNWGAFWLTWIWGVGHGVWLSLLLLPLTILTSLFTFLASVISIFSSAAYSWIAFGAVAILNLVIAYWFGRRGNEWAWSRRGSRDLAAAKNRERSWAIVGWIFGALIILSWIMFASSLILGEKSTATCESGVTFEVNGVDQCAVSDVTPTTTTYAGAGFSFDYKADWQVKKMSELLETGATDTSGDPVLFLTAAQLVGINQAIVNFKNNPSADFASFFSLLQKFKSEMNVTYTANGLVESSTDPAKEAAGQETQNICTGTDYKFDSNNPIIPERIAATTVGGKSGYGIASDPKCSTETYNIYANTPGGYITIMFSAKNGESLSVDQKLVLISLKIQ